jgi:hypothetical protein
VDNRDHGAVLLEVGEWSIQLAAGAVERHVFLRPPSGRELPVRLDGQVVGNLFDPTTLIDVAGTHRYRWSLKTYSSRGASGSPGRPDVRLSGGQQVYGLPDRVDHFLTPAPQGYRVKGTGAGESFSEGELVEVK